MPGTRGNGRDTFSARGLRFCCDARNERERNHEREEDDEAHEATSV
jgi:hypothetical protein